MPVINYTDPEETEWINSASHLWGIPLHPLGEINILDYYLGNGSLEQQYEKFLAGRFQVAFGGVMAYIAIYCVTSSTKMVIRKPRHLVSWCCLIPSILTTTDCMAFTSMELGVHYMNCRYIIWLLLFGVSISNFCSSLILLHKAYLVLCRAKWIIYASVLPLLSQLLFTYIMIPTIYARITPASGCGIHYPPFMPWYWLANALPLNLVFSVIFSYIGWKQYSRYGSDAWKKLTRDGIQVMLLVALCNIFCCIIAVTQVVGDDSDIFLATDCMLVNAILIAQHKDGHGTRIAGYSTKQNTYAISKSKSTYVKSRRSLV